MASDASAYTCCTIVSVIPCDSMSIQDYTKARGLARPRALLFSLHCTGRCTGVAHRTSPIHGQQEGTPTNFDNVVTNHRMRAGNDIQMPPKVVIRGTPKSIRKYTGIYFGALLHSLSSHNGNFHYLIRTLGELPLRCLFLDLFLRQIRSTFIHILRSRRAGIRT
jgi:hypothetical protein